MDSYEGGSWPDALGDAQFNEVFCKVLCKYGLVVNGVVAWIAAMLDSNPEDVWRDVAIGHFSDEEISKAKEDLQRAAGDNIAPQPNRTKDGRKVKEIDDIAKSLRLLKDKGNLPLIVTTAKMAMAAPPLQRIS